MNILSITRILEKSDLLSDFPILPIGFESIDDIAISYISPTMSTHRIIGNDLIPEFTLNVDKQVFKLKTNTITSKISQSQIESFKSIYPDNHIQFIEDNVTNVLVSELITSLTKELINTLSNTKHQSNIKAESESRVKQLLWDMFSYSPISNHDDMIDFVKLIFKESNMIHNRTRIGPGHSIIVSPITYTFISELPTFIYNTNSLVEPRVEARLVGSLDSRINVYVSPYVNNYEILLYAKGTKEDSSLKYILSDVEIKSIKTPDLNTEYLCKYKSVLARLPRYEDYHQKIIIGDRPHSLTDWIREKPIRILNPLVNLRNLLFIGFRLS